MARSPTRKRKLALSLKLARKWAKEHGYPKEMVGKWVVNRYIYKDSLSWEPVAVIEDFTASNGEWWCRVKDLTKNQLVNNPREW